MPLPSTRQSHMDIFHGSAPNVDDNHIIQSIAFKQNVVAKTADYTLLASDSGTVFTTGGATTQVEFTLPAVANSDGLVYWFINAKDSEMKLSAPTGTLCGFNDIAANSLAYTTASNQAGCGFMAVCDGTKWYVGCMPGQDSATITLAT